MNDRYYIKIIIRRIEKKLNWNKVSLWTDNDFKKLSLLIYQDTAISISPQTLKRLFGKVKYKIVYTTQPATKDALARFLDYPDWNTFVREQAHTIDNLFSFRRITSAKYLNNRIMGLLLGIILVISSLFILWGNKKKTVTFYAENVTGLTPLTVSFHYDISSFKNKKVYIDFDNSEAEDISKGELLNNRLTLINHCFESPGFYNVKISSLGKVLASAKIHSLSDGWNSYYFNDDNYSLRKFIFGLERKARDVENDGILYISPKELNSQGFNGNTVYYLEHMLYKDFKLSADSCAFEVKYKNSSDMGGISCYDAEFRMIGENGISSVLLVQKGCHRWSEITIGEKHLNGKYNDLPFLGADLSSWNTLKIVINNNVASIINNHDTIYTTQYSQHLGMMKGIRFVTKGSGAFDYVRLYNNSGELLYDENFGN
jgi:hypothetical protein